MTEVKAARPVNLRHRAGNSNPARLGVTADDGLRSTRSSAPRHTSRRIDDGRVMRSDSAASASGRWEDPAGGSAGTGLRCCVPVASGG